MSTYSYEENIWLLDYLSIRLILCKEGHQQNPEKEKIDEKQNDKRTVPQGSSVYLHIRSSLKKITALGLYFFLHFPVLPSSP